MQTVIKEYEDGTYEGMMSSDGLRSGRGTMKYTNGDMYEGEWKDDKKHGHGRCMWYHDNSVYEGEFVDGVMKGRGKKYGKDYIYEGEFEDNNYDGNGTLTVYVDDKSGDKKESYMGQWKGGKKHGYGKHITHMYHYKMFGSYRQYGMYEDNTVYEGMWTDDKKEGYGELTIGDCGRIFYEEDWADYGTHHVVGRKYEGEWKDDKKHGYGKSTTPDGKIATHTYEQGRWKVLHTNNQDWCVIA